MRKLSVNYLKIVNNIVDKEKSEYYALNKRKRHFWHSKSESISCRVRNKNPRINAISFAMNIRAYLINEDERFNTELSKTIDQIIKNDRHQLRIYAYSKFPDHSRETLDKNIGLIIGSLTDEEIREALNLKEIVSCRLLGYEKELFYLKCYSLWILPVFMLRCLYHLDYSHDKFIEGIEYEELGDLEKGLDFNYYLNKVKFL